LINRTLSLMAKHPLAAPQGLILCQHDTSERIVYNESVFELVQKRKYGNTTYTILTPKEPAQP
ncbi:MAG: RsmD family RNA methyltransferase, partial [candidate division Zixibacteria bacterium]|nr:RsmD family RNA methyltransferase [candidate division Zixibacteria bacterium]